MSKKSNYTPSVQSRAKTIKVISPLEPVTFNQLFYADNAEKKHLRTLLVDSMWGPIRTAQAYYKQQLQDALGGPPYAIVGDISAYAECKDHILKHLDDLEEIEVASNGMGLKVNTKAYHYFFRAHLNGMPLAVLPNRSDIDPLWVSASIFCRVKDKNTLSEAFRALKISAESCIPLDKIILSQDIKDRFRASTVDFIFNEPLKSKFQKHNMKFKRCVLLYGPPGCGKSTLVQWARQNFEGYDANIYTWDEFAESTFKYRDKQKPTMYILEDVDTMLTKRDGTIYDRRGTEFTFLLNMMDGATSLDNYVVIMTANNVKLLDKALMRDGRADEKLFLDYPTEEMKSEYLELLLKPMMSEPAWEQAVPMLAPLIVQKEMPFSTLDNIRKKYFIYGSLERAIQTTVIDEHEETTKSVGFSGGEK